MKTHILYSITFSENRTVYEIMSKTVVGERGATHDVTIWRIRVACWISKAICTYAHAYTEQYVILLFHSNSGFVNAPQCHVILPVLLIFLTTSDKLCNGILRSVFVNL